MAVAEGTSWEYTLGRIDERTESLERRVDERFESLGRGLGRVEIDVRSIEKTLDENMLTKTVSCTFLSVVTGLLATMIALK